MLLQRSSQTAFWTLGKWDHKHTLGFIRIASNGGGALENKGIYLEFL
jgi:hypothetical protein